MKVELEDDEKDEGRGVKGSDEERGGGGMT